MLALKVREKESSSLEDSYNIAMRLDSYSKADTVGTGLDERRPGRVKAV